MRRWREKMLGWARHPRAAWWLAGVAFTEASVFPLPPDLMLAPMCAMQPARTWRLASLTTAASVLGALVGYGLGRALMEEVAMPLVHLYGLEAAVDQAFAWMHRYGPWFVLAAGFSPIPFKAATIAAGAAQLALGPFLLACALSRGVRFALVALAGREAVGIWALVRRRAPQLATWAIAAGLVVAALWALR
ncbi:MAG: DedA family protein [Zetaproteobacteria bacterium]|nr:MAG: DedA family protein [Zetaproteobacteria bacterium]